ncbi:MAG: hypothetical protein ACK514_13780 [Bacteroidota bacterium]|jgi:hypothetical protein|nr:hypothetical protein [Cytophagales bacterium]
MSRGHMPVKGYFQRAKVFGYLILAAALGWFIFFIYQFFQQ